MSSQITPPTPDVAEEGNGLPDPLAGDWSEGMPGPVRAHGIPTPKRISLNGHLESPPQAPAKVHDAHELLQSEFGEPPPAEEPPPAFESSPAEEPPPAFESSPAEEPPPAFEPSPAEEAPPPTAEAAAPAEEPPFDPDVTPPSPAPAFAADEAAQEIPAAEETPPSEDPAIATAPQAEDAAPSPSEAAESAPTPWSEPVASSAEPATAIAWDETPAPSDPDVAPPWAPPGEAAPDEASVEPAHAEPALAAPSDTPAEAAPEPAAEAWIAPPADEPAAEQPPAPDEAWTAEAAQPVDEWKPEAPAAEFEEVRAPAAEAVPAAAADWSSLNSGPDWSAPAASQEAPAQEWSSPPPAGAQTDWSPATAPDAAPEAQWSAPEAAPPASGDESWLKPAEEPAQEWNASPEPSPEPAPAWNQPAVGASALEQLDSVPPEPEPGAAKELFGTVPTGGMLAGDEDQDEYRAPENEYGPPEELASPEEVLRPVSIDHSDPDLPEAIDEPARNGPRPQPLAAFRPPGTAALEVHGEHRVAIHTRGGRTVRGTVRDIDLSKSQFPLAPQGGKGIEAIYHSDVKAIFFMLAPGERASDGDGAKVRVTFADGRVIEGMREGADAKHGFFLVPSDAARTNTRRIYVSREATSEITDG